MTGKFRKTLSHLKTLLLPGSLLSAVASAKALFPKAAHTDETLGNQVKHLRRICWSGLTLLVLGLGLHEVVNHSDSGRAARVASYQMLVNLVSAPQSADPVYVVDIGDAFNLPDRANTDTRKLAQLVENLAKHNPAAIAIDIDFAALDEPFAAPNGKESDFPDWDGSIVKQAHALTRDSVPVYLAIGREVFAETTAAWFPKNLEGNYNDLAVFSLVPEVKGDQISTLDWLWVPSRKRPLPSIGRALADAYAAKHNLRFPSRTFLTEEIALEPTEEFNTRMHESIRVQAHGTLVFLNSTSIRALLASKIGVTSPSDLDPNGSSHLWPPSGLEGKIVVVGTTRSEREDKWNSPGIAEPQPGVLLHACLAYTLTGHRISEFVPWFNTCLIVGLTGLIWVLPLIACVRLIGRPEASTKKVSSIRATRIAAQIAAGLCTMIAAIVAWQLHIIWFDWLIILALLLLHPLLELFFHKVCNMGTSLADGVLEDY